MPTENRKEWIKVVGCAAAATVYVVALLALVRWSPMPTCKPGDSGLYIGGSMLIAGCPEKNR